MRAIVLPVALSLLSCAHSAEQPEPEPAAARQPAASHDAAGAKPAEAGKELSGAVEEAFDAAGYTYLRVSLDDGREIWAAATQQAIAVGSRVVLETSIKMENFHSKALGRTFAEIYFVNVASVGGAAPKAPTSAPDPAADMI